MKQKSKPKSPKTRLWHVAFTGDKILVSAGPIPKPYIEYRTIRTITAKAAGRRYQRNNVATALAGIDFETDNPMSSNFQTLTREMVKKWKKNAKSVEIVILKTTER